MPNPADFHTAPRVTDLERVAVLSAALTEPFLLASRATARAPMIRAALPLTAAVAADRVHVVLRRSGV
ncbi:hypothetical protein [Nocardia stercoris]|uniref:Uncharacterized protein n=1 Tax=Nocardia stercoris TaxID=2483361 RepID=A0A3M2KW55_9NOCA|nr:hypothetical protein [Nocardia stercoris]RMI29842.1 hypothetical protein EBN03_23880 [Nocardia stercoris]